MLFKPIKPMLLTLGKEITNTPDHLYEIKWDGWRILIHKEGKRLEAYTRHGNRVTALFPELKQVVHHIHAHTALLDCEGVVVRNKKDVFEDFAYRGRLQNKEKIELATRTHPATFAVFDVLYSEGSHLKEPLLERKERLANLIEPSEQIIPTPYVVGNGENLFEVTKEKGMEGIVEKPIDSYYYPSTRSSKWLKHKHFKLMAAVILGYKEKPFTMIVGAVIQNKMRPIASVEFGFKPEEKQAFRKIVSQIVVKNERDVTWLEPNLCCTIQYLEKTEMNHLRITSFKGFQFDKDPRECILN